MIRVGSRVKFKPLDGKAAVVHYGPRIGESVSAGAIGSVEYACNDETGEADEHVDPSTAHAFGVRWDFMGGAIVEIARRYLVEL